MKFEQITLTVMTEDGNGLDEIVDAVKKIEHFGDIKLLEYDSVPMELHVQWDQPIKTRVPERNTASVPNYGDDFPEE